MSDGKYFLWVDFATWGLPPFRNNVVHVGDLCWLAKRYCFDRDKGNVIFKVR